MARRTVLEQIDDEDPDENLAVPTREVKTALALAKGLLVAFEKREELAEEFRAHLVPIIAQLGSAAQLPEVGPVTDADRVRLFAYRVVERLKPYVPDVSVPSPPPVVREDEDLPIRRGTRADALEDDDLSFAFVWWDDIQPTDLKDFRHVLEAATDEKPLQRHLASNPLLLVQHLGGGHGRWVLSHKRLGSEYVPDFVIGERSSGGFEWQFVELQSPRARLFVKSSGRQSPHLDEGIRQIQEWRRWLDDNRDYARRPRSRNGLGLADVSGKDQGLLIIGREADLDDNDRQRRRQLGQDLRISIHTYDWLLRKAEMRIREITRFREGHDHGA